MTNRNFQKSYKPQAVSCKPQITSLKPQAVELKKEKYTFRNLKVWQKAHVMVLKIYQETRNFPEVEKYGLVAQARRSIASVATNIVEGYKRKSDKDFAHFLNIAETSLEETKYHLLLSFDLKYLNEYQYKQLINTAEELGSMLFSFQKKLKSS